MGEPPKTPSLGYDALVYKHYIKMMRQSEYKKRFDPELGRYTRQHIYGEGITDVFKSFGQKLFGKTVKSAVKKGAKKAVTSAATKTGEHVGKKAGDKIVQLLSKGRDAPKNPPAKKVKTTPNKTMTQKEIDQMLNNLLSGGSTRKIKGNLRFP